MRSIQSGAREPGSEVEAIMQVEALLSKIKTQILADRMPLQTTLTVVRSLWACHT